MRFLFNENAQPITVDGRPKRIERFQIKRFSYLSLF